MVNSSSEKIAVVGHNVQQAILDELGSQGYEIHKYNDKDYNGSLQNFLDQQDITSVDALVLRSQQIFSSQEKDKYKDKKPSLEDVKNLIPKDFALRIGSGVDQFDLIMDLLSEKQVPLMNTPGNGSYLMGNSSAVAEKTFAEMVDGVFRWEAKGSSPIEAIEETHDVQILTAQMIFRERNLSQAYQDVNEGSFKSKGEYRGDQVINSQGYIDLLKDEVFLQGETVLITSDGSIGQINATLAKASGAEVYMVGRSFTKEKAEAAGIKFAGNDISEIPQEILDKVTVLQETRPSKQNTKGTIDGDFLSKMPNLKTVVGNGRIATFNFKSVKDFAHKNPDIYFYFDVKKPQEYKDITGKNMSGNIRVSPTIGSETNQVSGSNGVVVQNAVDLIKNYVRKGVISNLVNTDMASSLSLEKLKNISVLPKAAKYMTDVGFPPLFAGEKNDEYWKGVEEKLQNYVSKFKEAFKKTSNSTEEEAEKYVYGKLVSDVKGFVRASEKLLEISAKTGGQSRVI
jgi:lactate dehydrogenase-like 2-hydroxyacid dehydrogenase